MRPSILLLPVFGSFHQDRQAATMHPDLERPQAYNRKSG